MDSTTSCVLVKRDEKMTGLPNDHPIIKFCSNSWEWNFDMFCKKMGFDPQFEYAKASFGRFQNIASNLASFDREKLAILCGECGDMEFVKKEEKS